MKSKTVNKIMAVIGLICVVTVCPLLLSPSTIRSVGFAESVVVLTDGLGHGSGVIISPTEVLTAKHVAMHSGMIVKTMDGETYNIRTTRMDPDSDLAVVEIDGVFKQRPLKLGQELSKDDSICVIGAPFDMRLTGTISRGRVVNVNFDLEPGYMNLDMIDAQIGPGSSGGPVIHGRRVCGILVRGNGTFALVVPVGELDSGLANKK